MKYIPFEAEV